MTYVLLTLRDVADELGCSVATVKRRIAVGALAAFADGRLVRVRDVDLARYVAERVTRRNNASLGATPPGRTLKPGERLWH
jgi:excisionase family DNA binding protein